MKIFDFIGKAVSDGLTNTPSTRRLAFLGFTVLGGVAICFGVGVAVGIVFGLSDVERLSYYKETLSFIEWMFATGVAGTGLTYSATEIAKSQKEKKDELA